MFGSVVSVEGCVLVKEEGEEDIVLGLLGC